MATQAGPLGRRAPNPATLDAGQALLVGRRPRRRADAVTLLTVAVVLLVCIPSTLVIKPLGASGNPGSLIGIAALVWWATARFLPDLGLASGLQPIRIAILVLAVSILASYTEAFSRSITPVEARAADRGLLSLASWAGLALLAADGTTSRGRVDTMIRRVVAAAAALAAVGMIQFAFGIDLASAIRLPGLTPNGDVDFISGRSEFRRVAGTATHPIEFAVVLTLALPFAIYVATTARRGRRFLPWTGVVLIVLAIPLSVSRTAVLGLLVATATLFVGWSWRRRVAALLLLPPFLGVVKVLAPGLLGTLSGLFLSLRHDPSYQGRLADYVRVDAFVAEAPALGRGFRTFLPTEYFYLDNQYLGAAVELGMVGLAAILVVFATTYFTARGARRRTTDPATRDLAQAFAAAALVAVVTFGTFDALSFPMVSGLLFLLIGCCGALWRLTTDDSDCAATASGRQRCLQSGPAHTQRSLAG